MKRIPILLILILISMHPAGKAAGDSEFPEWIDELHSIAAITFRTQVGASAVKLPDRIEDGRSFTVCLKGQGGLEDIPDPFAAMERMFCMNGWRYVPVYQADGHSSSSFAYEKGNHLCNIHVNIDSSCDDEETGHVPSEFWFEIYCREK